MRLETKVIEPPPGGFFVPSILPAARPVERRRLIRQRSLPLLRAFERAPAYPVAVVLTAKQHDSLDHAAGFATATVPDELTDAEARRKLERGGGVGGHLWLLNQRLTANGVRPICPATSR